MSEEYREQEYKCSLVPAYDLIPLNSDLVPSDMVNDDHDMIDDQRWL